MRDGGLSCCTIRGVSGIRTCSTDLLSPALRGANPKRIRTSRRAPRLVPWAWGVNGVASVVAAVLAVLIGMAIGFAGVALVAGGIYAVGTGALLLVLRNHEDTASD